LHVIVNLICVHFLLTAGTFVAVGSHMKVKYLGSLCELEVVELVTEDGETVGTVPSTDEDVISNRLSSVNFSREPNTCQRNLSQRFFRCINGTRVTLYKPPSADSTKSHAAVTLDDIGGACSQKEFLTRLVSSVLDVRKAEAIKHSGKL